MTKPRVKAFFAALVLMLLAPVAALAQTTHWVQIEAHATLRTAEEFATRYQERIGNIAGFRIAGGWYALAVGPFATAEDAEARRTQLLAAREIREDAYVTDDTIYGQQFWPVGGQAATQPPVVVERPADQAVAADQSVTDQPAQTDDTGNAVAATDTAAAPPPPSPRSPPPSRWSRNSPSRPSTRPAARNTN